MKLEVLFSGGRLCITGPSGRQYEYLPSRDKGVIEVDEADVASFLEMTYEDGCRCSDSGHSTRLHYFKEIN